MKVVLYKAKEVRKRINTFFKLLYISSSKTLNVLIIYILCFQSYQVQCKSNSFKFDDINSINVAFY